MKIVLKSQILAISFSLFWIIYLNILAFFDQPDRGLQYINWFVNGFAALFGILVMLMTKYVSGGRWSFLPLILIPEFFIYQQIFTGFFSSLLGEGYKGIFHFLSLTTLTVYLIAVTLGVILGIIFGRTKKA